MRTGTGFVGTGYMGQLAHVENYAQLHECRAVAVAERREKLGRAVAERYGIPTVYSNHRDLLDDPDIDAVVCIVDFHDNYHLGKEILEAGKSLFTEKPMVLRYDEGKELVEIARKKTCSTRLDS